MSDDVIEGWQWMPLSERQVESPTYHDVLFPTPTGPLADALDKWITEAVRSGTGNRVQRINIIAGKVLLDRSNPYNGPVGRVGGTSLLEVVDLVVHLLDEEVDDSEVRPHRTSSNSDSVQALADLQRMLSEGRSLWQLGRLPDQSLGLVQRVNDASRELARTVLSNDAIAVTHLRKAWSELYQRDSQPKLSLDQSVYALESALRSIVSPDNVRSTLGTIIRDMKASPEKWAVPIGNVELLAQRLDDIWRKQPRHGADDKNSVIDVERPLAEAALYEAITLVHWCSAGLFYRTTGQESN